jgi:hypothetical protein
MTALFFKSVFKVASKHAAPLSKKLGRFETRTLICSSVSRLACFACQQLKKRKPIHSFAGSIIKAAPSVTQKGGGVQLFMPAKIAA